MVKPTTWLLSLFLLTLQLSASGVDSAKFTLVNQCNYTVWPASSGNATLSTTGFILRTGESSTVTAPAKWTGRFWGRTLCATDSATGNFSCLTGDCGSGNVSCGGNRAKPPATLVEFSTGNAVGGDFYDVNLVDGYNVPVMVVPVGGNCSSAGCPADLNGVCPTELKVVREKTVVGCKGACGAFKLPQYCCTGNFGTRETCQPSNYSRVFKRFCPQAYSFPFDDENSTFNCSSSPEYRIVFCPNSNKTSQRLLDLGESVGSSLTTGNGTSQWLSPSGDFAFGFYQIPNDLYLLAIWYDKIPNRTIIWYANGDTPAPRGSRLELNDSLGLVLTNPQGLELWRSDLIPGTIYSGLMNDDGNFQLLDQNFVPLWESFNHPTDTLVPTQVMQLNGKLSSRQGEFNFSHGRFKLHLQEDGNFVFNLVNLPYYSTQTADAKNQTNVGKQLIFDKSGSLYILKKSGEKFRLTEPEIVPTDSFYYKATINFDGVFTISYYPKDPKNGQSWVTIRAKPENICLNFVVTNGEGVEGVCGFNSICTIEDSQRPTCNCPEGYSLFDSNNMYGGCKPNFQVICQEGGQQDSQDDQYIMKVLPDTNWPRSDYETLSPSTLQECKESCLQDCLCVLVNFSGSSCWKKKLPLTNGRKDQGVNGTSFLKLMKNHTSLPTSNVKKDHDTLIIVISVVLSGSVFVILVIGAICFGFSWKPRKMKSNNRTNNSVADRNLRNFTFEEIVEASNNFEDELGRGSFGIVYKGKI